MQVRLRGTPCRNQTGEQRGNHSQQDAERQYAQVDADRVSRWKRHWIRGEEISKRGKGPYDSESRTESREHERISEKQSQQTSPPRTQCRPNADFFMPLHTASQQQVRDVEACD